MIYLNFSERLKQLRLSAGYSQVELANAVKMTKAAISNLENSRKNPSLETVIALADFFNVTTDYILGRCDK